MQREEIQMYSEHKQALMIDQRVWLQNRQSDLTSFEEA